MAKKITTVVVVLVVIAAIGMLGYFGYGYVKGHYFKKTEIGSLDRDTILKSTEFVKANEKVEEKIVELEKQYGKMAQNLRRPEQQEELYMRYRQDVEALRAKEIKPLLDKAQAAVALVAVDKKLKIVLDKKIVVCGALDVTEEVKTKFKQEGELKAPSDNIGKECRIGYFDQEVVRSLKLFRDVDRQLYDSFQTIKKEIDERTKGVSEDQKKKIFEEYNMKFMKEREQKYKPALEKVTVIVKGVAQKKELDMVVDKQFVMYGGRNVTDEVVDELK